MGKLDCDIAIIGGGMGGVAAALAACSAGRSVILSEVTDWIGGQATAQGVSALDEHKFIESPLGCTRQYAQFRQRIRDDYHQRYAAPVLMPDWKDAIFPGQPLNPGNGWVSRLCFEPLVGVKMLTDMLAPYLQTGQLRLLLCHSPAQAECAQDRVLSVTLRDEVTARTVTVRAAYFLDATELGDLLPLTNTDFVTGAESAADTGEPHAQHGPVRPSLTQGFTYCFAVDFCEGERHVIEKPRGYDKLKQRQPYGLDLLNRAGEILRYRMFAENDVQRLLPFWSYRRLIHAKLLDPHGVRGLRDIVMINWASNDYYFRGLTEDAATAAQAHTEAKRLALGFLYWLQTECPRDDGQGLGYPELRLRADVMGSLDGLSKHPYIRESRRIVPLKRILEQHISADLLPAPLPCPDSVGIGWYSIDIHHCVGGDVHDLAYAPTHPFQIPLGALIPIRTQNLIPACKNIGSTHITNGAYRLHPVEWAIGEAAGLLAAYCLSRGVSPQHVWETSAHLCQLQDQLREYGAPIEWNHTLFA